MTDEQPVIRRTGGDGTTPDTKIRITEDRDATGETAAAYDYWRAGSGRTQVPGIIKCFGARPDFLFWAAIRWPGKSGAGQKRRTPRCFETVFMS